MEIIGLIAEYSPFHNGHLYQLNEIKELYPDSIIILILNGYFLQRGLVSIESKKEKTRLALKYGCDIVCELPFIFGSNSADTFSSASLEILNDLKINKIVFGSESNDLSLLTDIAKKQLTNNYNEELKTLLDQGINYPTAINKVTNSHVSSPNDILGISYIKTILKNNYTIEPISIKRTNDYHDINSNDSIISASNIREKINKNESIDIYIPEGNINTVNKELLFNLIKYKIISDDDLSKYLTVDEGIENRLKKVINNVNSIEELVNSIKTKRYTYNRIMRMLIHILIGLTKEDRNNINNNEYIRLLGISSNGQKYINKIKKETKLPIITKFTNINSKIAEYELKAANIYQMITNDNVLNFELNNKPIKKDE